MCPSCHLHQRLAELQFSRPFRKSQGSSRLSYAKTQGAYSPQLPLATVPSAHHCTVSVQSRWPRGRAAAPSPAPGAGPTSVKPRSQRPPGGLRVAAGAGVSRRRPRHRRARRGTAPRTAPRRLAAAPAARLQVAGRADGRWLAPPTQLRRHLQPGHPPPAAALRFLPTPAPRPHPRGGAAFALTPPPRLRFPRSPRPGPGWGGRPRRRSPPPARRRRPPAQGCCPARSQQPPRLPPPRTSLAITGGGGGGGGCGAPRRRCPPRAAPPRRGRGEPPPAPRAAPPGAPGCLHHPRQAGREGGREAAEGRRERRGGGGVPLPLPGPLSGQAIARRLPARLCGRLGAAGCALPLPGDALPNPYPPRGTLFLPFPAVPLPALIPGVPTLVFFSG